MVKVGATIDKEAAGRMVGHHLASNKKANQTWPRGKDLRGTKLPRKRGGNTMDGGSNTELKRQKMEGGESTKKASNGQDSGKNYNFYNCTNMTFN